MIKPKNPPPAPPPDPPRRKPLVYVAGSSREMERAGRVILELQERGFRIAFDWPAQIKEDGGLTNEGLPADLRVSHSRQAVRAAADCDVFMLLVPHEQTIGAWVELGVALEAGKPLVIASGLVEDFERSIFTALVSRRFSRGMISRYQPGDGVGEAHREMDNLAIAWLDGYASSFDVVAREAAE